MHRAEKDPSLSFPADCSTKPSADLPPVASSIASFCEEIKETLCIQCKCQVLEDEELHLSSLAVSLLTAHASSSDSPSRSSDARCSSNFCRSTSLRWERNFSLLSSVALSSAPRLQMAEHDAPVWLVEISQTWRF